MRPIITAFATSPDGGRGLARDMPVRWALEETGEPYDVRLVTFAELKLDRHRSRQPFGQIPTYEDGNLVLFESGAIVLHVAGLGPGLLPDDPAARARAISWMFAAVSSVEPHIVEREQMGYTERDRDWYAARLSLLDARVSQRLADLARRLGSHDWLDGAFSAGDLMMVCVLRRIFGTPLLAGFPTLAAYVERAEARPAFQRAFAAQLTLFEKG